MAAGPVSRSDLTAWRHPSATRSSLKVSDLVGQHLRQIYGLPILAERLTALPGVVMTREIHEKFEE